MIARRRADARPGFGPTMVGLSTVTDTPAPRTTFVLPWCAASWHRATSSLVVPLHGPTGPCPRVWSQGPRRILRLERRTIPADIRWALDVPAGTGATVLRFPESAMMAGDGPEVSKVADKDGDGHISVTVGADARLVEVEGGR